MKRLNSSNSENNVTKKKHTTIVLPAELTNVSLENIQVASQMLQLQPSCTAQAIRAEDISSEGCIIKKERPIIVLPAELSNVSLENIQVENHMLHMQPDCATEVVHAEDGTPISQHDMDDSSTSDSNFGALIEYMDITEPLNHLRTLLEQRTGTSLVDYKFYLQDTQELDATRNLVNQCVQGEGLVQINVNITEKQGIKKINIIDVLKPAEEIPLSPELSQGDSFVETSTGSHKLVSSSADDTQQVTRWTVDPEFRQLQDKLNIPQDPMLWSDEHVKSWVEWASTHFNLPEVDLNDWNFSGVQLMSLSHDSFKRKIPFDPSDLFWTHLELLRKFKIVAVIQQCSGSSKDVSSAQRNNAAKCKPRTPRIGSPRIAYDGGPGNHSGNNGQIQLWQFLLELLTDKDHRDYIQWVGDEGEFKLINPEMVAQLWGHRKNKPTMNYEKLSRALRYYYDGEMIAKVHGKRFVYKFVCDLKSLLGYDASELNRLVSECENKTIVRELDSSTLLSYATTDGNSNS